MSVFSLKVDPPREVHSSEFAEEIQAMLVAADWFEERGSPEADKLRRLAERLLSVPIAESMAVVKDSGIRLDNMQWFITSLQVGVETEQNFGGSGRYYGGRRTISASLELVGCPLDGFAGIVFEHPAELPATGLTVEDAAVFPDPDWDDDFP